MIAAINFHEIGIKLKNLHNLSCFGPPAWLVCGLVLHHDCVTLMEWGKRFGSSGQLLLLGHVPLGQSAFTHLCSLSPFCSDREFAGLEWNVVTEDTPKDHLCRREASDRVGTVTVEEESTGHPITVKTAIGP